MNSDEGGASDEDAMNQEEFEEFIEKQYGQSGYLLDLDKLSSLLAPSAYGKTFMVHYAV